MTHEYKAVQFPAGNNLVNNDWKYRQLAIGDFIDTDETTYGTFDTFFGFQYGPYVFVGGTYTPSASDSGNLETLQSNMKPSVETALAVNNNTDPPVTIIPSGYLYVDSNPAAVTRRILAFYQTQTIYA